MTDIDVRQAGSTDLIGRGSEVAALSAFLDRIGVDGESLLVLGGPGIGKSALLEAAAVDAGARGWRVLRAVGTEFEADVSYAVLGQALAPLLGELAELDGTHRLALSAALGFEEGLPERLAVSNAMLALLSRASRVDPVLLIVDDVPWLDRASAAVVGLLARRLSGQRVGLLAGSRIGEPGFFESAGLPELEVGPLDPASSRQLLSEHFPELAPRVRARILADSQGNPLALLELPRALTEEQQAGRAPLPTVLPRGRRLRGLFDHRVRSLTQETLDLLLLAAFDRSGDLRVLSAIGSDAALHALVPAEEAGLIRVDENARRVVFRHPLIRAAVVELAGPERQRRAHALLAELAADQPELRAWHLAEASDGPDEQVADLLEQAARRMLGRGDAVGAVTALTRAADLSPDAADRSRRLVYAAYVGGDVTGDVLATTKLLDEARLIDAEEGVSLVAATAAAWVLITLDGNVDTAHRLLVGAIELQLNRPGARDEGFEDALYTLEIICYFGGRGELWAAFDDLLERLGRDAPPSLVLYSKTSADPVRTSSAALKEVDEEVASLSQETDPARIIRVSLIGAFLDRLPFCRAALWRLVEDGRSGGAIASAIVALVVLSDDDYMTGRWEEARQLADEGLALAEEHGYGLQTWPCLHVHAMLAAFAGDHTTVRAITDQMLQWALPRQVNTIVRFARQALCLSAIGRGDFEDAFREADAICPAGTLESHVPQSVWLLFDLVEAAVATGRHAEGAAHVRAMRDADVGRLSPRMALSAAGAAALVAQDDDAQTLFEEALAIPGAERYPFDLARVRLAYGQHLRRVRALPEAQVQLSTALDAFDRLGARPWAIRARNELRAAGRSQGGSAADEETMLNGLDLEIATLAASGLTNRQIGDRLYLSHRTVGARLHRIFPKLGITSRAALRDALENAPAK